MLPKGKPPRSKHNSTPRTKNKPFRSEVESYMRRTFQTNTNPAVSYRPRRQTQNPKQDEDPYLFDD